MDRTSTQSKIESRFVPMNEQNEQEQHDEAAARFAYENPPIAAELKVRIENAIDFHLGDRQWDKKKAYLKAGIGRTAFEKLVYFFVSCLLCTVPVLKVLVYSSVI